MFFLFVCLFKAECCHVLAGVSYVAQTDLSIHLPHLPVSIGMNHYTLKTELWKNNRVYIRNCISYVVHFWDRILDKSNIREERGLLWFTVPGYSPSQWEVMGAGAAAAGHTVSAGRRQRDGCCCPVLFLSLFSSCHQPMGCATHVLDGPSYLS